MSTIFRYESSNRMKTLDDIDFEKFRTKSNVTRQSQFVNPGYLGQSRLSTLGIPDKWEKTFLRSRVSRESGLGPVVDPEYRVRPFVDSGINKTRAVIGNRAGRRHRALEITNLYFNSYKTLLINRSVYTQVDCLYSLFRI